MTGATDIRAVLSEVAHSYPPQMVSTQLRDIPRIMFNIQLALNGCDPHHLSVCDIGGGVGLFSPGCAALGIKTMLIDDFADTVNRELGDEPLKVHKK